MGGPDMAPQPPQRSEHPGEAATLLDTPTGSQLAAPLAPASPAHSMLGEVSEGAVTSAPSEVLAGGFAEGAQRLFQALLLGSVGRPVPAPQRVLGTVPDLPRPLPELTRRRRVERSRGWRPRSARRARGAAAADAGERLLERRLHRALVAVGDDHAPELGQRLLLRRGEVERLDVDQRLIDRDRQE